MPEMDAFGVCDRAPDRPEVKPDPSPAVLDLTRLLEMFGDEPATISRILGLFVKETATDMADLFTACASGDASETASVAHRVKGAAAGVGAEWLRSGAEQLESVARRGQMADASQLMCRLQSEFERVKETIAEDTAKEDTGYRST